MDKAGPGRRAAAGIVEGRFTLTIRLWRLPDIHSLEAVLEHGLERYGRFALLRDGGFWFADAVSSHPAITVVGWYWALDTDGILLVSARGAALDGESLFTSKKDVLARLVEELVGRRYITKPSAIRLEA